MASQASAPHELIIPGAWVRAPPAPPPLVQVRASSRVQRDHLVGHQRAGSTRRAVSWSATALRCAPHRDRSLCRQAANASCAPCIASSSCSPVGDSHPPPRRSRARRWSARPWHLARPPGPGAHARAFRVAALSSSSDAAVGIGPSAHLLPQQVPRRPVVDDHVAGDVLARLLRRQVVVLTTDHHRDLELEIQRLRTQRSLPAFRSRSPRADRHTGPSAPCTGGWVRRRGRW
jgi:hypothetical protein